MIIKSIEHNTGEEWKSKRNLNIEQKPEGTGESILPVSLYLSKPQHQVCVLCLTARYLGPLFRVFLATLVKNAPD